MLHRLLAAADLTAGAVASSVAGLLVGLPLMDALTLGAICAIVLPAIAFVSGLYAAGDLGTWASGVGDTRQLVFATLAFSWPVYALLACSRYKVRLA